MWKEKCIRKEDAWDRGKAQRKKRSPVLGQDSKKATCLPATKVCKESGKCIFSLPREQSTMETESILLPFKLLWVGKSAYIIEPARNSDKGLLSVGKKAVVNLSNPSRIWVRAGYTHTHTHTHTHVWKEWQCNVSSKYLYTVDVFGWSLVYSFLHHQYALHGKKNYV